jgi:transposase
VFVDECGTHTSMSRLRARAPKGQRAYGKVPRNHGKNTTLLASMTSEGMGPCMAVVGSTTKAVFEAYVDRALAPSLRPGQVVVVDNLGAHRGERVRALVEARGCSLVYLPPYSPDFWPIEEAFSKLKTLLRKATRPGHGWRSWRPSAERSLGDHSAGRRGLLRPLRLPARRSTVMRTAVRRGGNDFRPCPPISPLLPGHQRPQ